MNLCTAASTYRCLIGIALGILLGYAAPSTGEAMRPLGDGFIKLIKMLIGPIVFSTVVVGLARMGAMKQAGRIGWRAFVYFEIVSTLALVIGLVVVSIVKPGVGLNIDASKLDASAVSAYANQSHELTTVGFLLNIIPTSFVSAFAQGEILQVLLVSVLFGLALPQPRRSRPAAGRPDRAHLAHASSPSSASSCGSRRSARSARWRSPSANTASARCCRSAS